MFPSTESQNYKFDLVFLNSSKEHHSEVGRQQSWLKRNILRWLMHTRPHICFDSGKTTPRFRVLSWTHTFFSTSPPIFFHLLIYVFAVQISNRCPCPTPLSNDIFLLFADSPLDSSALSFYMLSCESSGLLKQTSLISKRSADMCFESYNYLLKICLYSSLFLWIWSDLTVQRETCLSSNNTYAEHAIKCCTLIKTFVDKLEICNQWLIN